MKYNTTFHRRFLPWKLPIPFLSMLILLFSFLTSFSVHAQVPELWGMAGGGGTDGAGTVYKMKADGSSFDVIHSFEVSVPGQYPNDVIQASNGKLYGTASGGAYGNGIIYEYDPATQTFNSKHDFTYDDGTGPASLIEADNGKLYGLASYGGTYGYGTLFEFDPSSEIFVKKFDFDYLVTGAWPLASLVQASNGKLYGTTNGGGNGYAGTIFEYDPISESFTKEYDFDYGTNGSNPTCSLTEGPDGRLFGTASQGGTFYAGVLFAFDPTIEVFVKQYDFYYANGGYPYSDLIIGSDGNLYGMTAQGGNSSAGVIYQFETGSSTYTKLYDFDNTNGGYPYGNLIEQPGNKLFGMTSGGGNLYSGVIFEFDLTSSTYSKKVDFNQTNGSYPYGSLIEASDGLLYGCTQYGGSIGFGVLFSYEAGATETSPLVNFFQSEAFNPVGSVMQANNGKVYGMTAYGGNNGFGVIFECDPTTNTLIKKYDFDIANGGNLCGYFTQASDGKLYGMATGGGAYYAGTIFQYDPATESFTKKFDFDGGVNGGYPFNANLVQMADGKMYGVTGYGGANYAGVIFEYDPVTNTVSKKHDFQAWPYDGVPFGGLVQATNGRLYGMTYYGGVNNYGVIYEFNPASGSYFIIHEFDWNNGGNPYGNLVQASNGLLYGMTSGGGNYGSGVIFEIDPATDAYSKIFDFDIGVTGGSPNGSLIQSSNGKLYGNAIGGGANGYGTSFEFDIETHTLTKLHDFDYSSGIWPNLDLAEVETGSDVITTTAVSAPLCAGNSGAVDFSANQSFNPGNIFTAELSDGVGNFSGAVSIGSLESTESGTIEIIIPESTAEGSGYRIRVVSSDPEITGYNNGSNLIITIPKLFYADADGDGFGDLNDAGTVMCTTAGFSDLNTDCNDSDPAIHPGVCDLADGNGIDDDCNGTIDDNGGALTYYTDADYDGFGAGDPVYFCSNPGFGYSLTNDDCNNGDYNINPWAWDYNSNGIDDNCDGCVDQNINAAFVDADGDGYGTGDYVFVCNVGPGYSYYSGDCNDNDPNVYPGANEVSNGSDDNCDGQADELQTCSPNIEWEHSFGGTGYDQGNDVAVSPDGGYVVCGYSDSHNFDVSCNPQFGWVIQVDQFGHLNWQACFNAQLNDVLATADNGYVVAGGTSDFFVAKMDAAGNILWQKEFGGSGYDAAYAVCSADDGGYVIAGYTQSSDGDVSGFHGGFYDMWVIKVSSEGNLVWQKCLGGNNDEIAQSIVKTSDGKFLVGGYTLSSDGDVTNHHGFYDGWLVNLNDDGSLDWEQTFGTSNYEVIQQAIQTTDGGYALLGWFGTGNFERLDADRNVLFTQWLSNGAAWSLAATPDDGYVLSGYAWNQNSNDNDAWAAKYRNDNTLVWSKLFGGSSFEQATEILPTDAGYIAAGYSHSSDGDVSNNKGNDDFWVVKLSGDPDYGLHTYYADADGDGYGNANDSISDVSCVPLPGYSIFNTDCNDADATVNPAVVEDCFNGVDNDCNGVIDDGAPVTLYADADGDGFGDLNNSIVGCVGTPGYVLNFSDCNDGNASINPYAVEICDNGIDDNCDGINLVTTTFYADADGDGYGDINSSVVDCNQPSGYVSNADDCNDSDWSINPGAYDYDGNGIDNNCDGCIDGYGGWYWPDADGDGYGELGSDSVLVCGNTPGYSWVNSDCDDNDPTINPGAYDYNYNGIDDNCDGCIDGDVFWLYPDADGDGYGDSNGDGALVCPGTPGYGWYGDCNDDDPTINPGAYDYQDGNGIDNNCDGCIDSYVSNVFVDADGDGYGAGNQVQICGNIAGYSYYNGDCNDADASIYPGANELTNGIDDNCDGQADEIQVCTPSIQWEQSLGGTGYDEAKSIVESGDGGYVVAGYAYSYDGDVTCQGYWGWVTKVDKDGNLVWRTCVSGYSYSIALTSDNGFIVAGEYNDNFSLAKIDSDGNLLWQQQYGGSNYDVGRAVSATDDGGGVAAGYIYSNDGDVTGFHGAADIWVIKVNNSGDLVWQKCLGGSGDDYALSVSRTLNGGFLVTGYTTSGDGDVADFNGYYDGWILELDDSSGDLLWEDAIGTSGYESLDAGIQTSDGGYALIGYVGNGNFSKLDNDRNFQWTIWLPNGANEVVQAADGGYAVSGTGWYVPHSSPDAWAAKLKSTGELQWSKYFGGTDFDYADDILQADDGGYIVAGINNSNDGDVSDGIGNGDYWLVKLSEDPPSGLQTYYADADGDGYGNSTDSISDISCIAPPGYSYYNTDCNDAESSIHPNAFEDCLNGIDDDCNGVIDDGTGDTPFYADVDGDGFGNVNAVVYDCSPPDGYVSNKDDCDDGNAAVHPGADEICNGIDDNCNNEVDEGYTLYTFFADGDGDAYGNHSVYIVSCDNVAPDGYVTDDSDCDDENAAVNPGATEIQNGIDDDCDGAVDEGFCSVPTGLFNDAITTTSAHLHWTEPLNAKRYKIQYMPADGSTPPVNLTVLAPASYVNITGLSTFTLYKWRMKTRCNDGSSSVWTETVGFKTAPFKEGALEKSPAFDVKLYPNPTSGWVNVEVNAVTEQSVVIKFYDIVGKEVYSEEDGLQSGIFSRQIDLSFLSSGTYFLKVIHDGSNEVRKLVMEK